ncbi:MAG TPA: 4-hydroxy-tetrahydrodipicolinate reductase [Burkholderiaceae bacterium]|nr:4-hydroxy-tetrahydrodipicolinate reductase [Burkholderiaceae bacterium]
MRIAIAGANGRMGRMLIDAVLQSDDMTLAAALDRPGSPVIGQDAGTFSGQQTGVLITDDLTALTQADCLIDFTLPEALDAHLEACLAHNTRYVVGTTGLDDKQKQAIQRAGQHIAIVFAPNMSMGVNVTLKLLEVAARLLSSGFDVEVFEAHHRHKVDAPSGTAIAMGEAVANAWGKELDTIADWTRHGHTGPRETGNIGFSVVRGGDIVGDHTVYFCGQGERIEITHRSSSRATYAQGSLQAARYLARKDFGVFDMQDVLTSMT